MRRSRKRRVQVSFANGRLSGVTDAAAGRPEDPEAASPPVPRRQPAMSRAEKIQRRVSRSWANLAAQRILSKHQEDRARELDLAGRARVTAQRADRFEHLPRLSNEEIELAAHRAPPPPPPPPHHSVDDGTYESMEVRMKAKPAVPPKRGFLLPKVCYFKLSFLYFFALAHSMLFCRLMLRSRHPTLPVSPAKWLWTRSRSPRRTPPCASTPPRWPTFWAITEGCARGRDNDRRPTSLFTRVSGTLFTFPRLFRSNCNTAPGSLLTQAPHSVAMVSKSPSALPSKC